MKQDFMQQLQQWHEEDRFQDIIEAIQALPEQEQSHKLKGILARALNNHGCYEEALVILDATASQGQQEANWHYRRGYANYYLNREEEAVQDFLKAAELEPDDCDAWLFIQWCYQYLNQPDLAAHAAEERYHRCHDKLEMLLEDLYHLCPATCQMMDGCLYLPEWELTIQLQIEEIRETAAVLYFYLQKPQWDRNLFECTVGMGSSSRRALDMALNSFVWGILSSIEAMYEVEALPLTTMYDNRPHNWQVSIGHLVGVGDTPQEEQFRNYWDLLKAGIADRLGNQKVSYVKVYAARDGEHITGECRINDIVSPELSQLIAEQAALWPTEDFGTHKQFFFLQQGEDTFTPYPYTEQQLEEMTKQYIQMFLNHPETIPMNELIGQVAEAIGDYDLAEELYCFLPELCAIQEFEQINYGEVLDIARGAEVTRVYRTQLASYCLFEKILNRGFEQEWWPAEVYGKLIMGSAVYDAIMAAEADGEDLTTGGAKMTLCCHMDENYQLR